MLQVAACMLHPKAFNTQMFIDSRGQNVDTVMYRFTAPNTDICFFKHTSGLKWIACLFVYMSHYYMTPRGVSDVVMTSWW